MSVPPIQWEPFSSPEERLAYLKEHKLTPKTYTEPKELIYAGIDTPAPVPCAAEGVADSCTLVIRIGEELHCIHPDYLLEMQSRPGSRSARRQRTKRTAPAAAKPTEPEIDFVAIDFETATADRNSACALGIAVVRQMEVTETWYHLIQPPENRYEEGTVRIHGITPAQTANQPTLDELWPELSRFFEGTLVLAHNAHFDVGVLRRSLHRSMRVANFRYADTLHMVKGIVPGRHGLDACCDYFGIPLEHHHNALDDAVACARIAIVCAKAGGFDHFSDYLKKNRIVPADFHQKNNPYQRYAAKAVRISDVIATVDQFDLTHPLYQKSVVFTGDLSIERASAMQLAVNKGAVIRSSVSAKTDVLVIGRQGAETAPSGKERKAKELLESGKGHIRLMEEEEFLTLVDGYGEKG